LSGGTSAPNLASGGRVERRPGSRVPHPRPPRRASRSSTHGHARPSLESNAMGRRGDRHLGGPFTPPGFYLQYFHTPTPQVVGRSTRKTPAQPPAGWQLRERDPAPRAASGAHREYPAPQRRPCWSTGGVGIGTELQRGRMARQASQCDDVVAGQTRAPSRRPAANRNQTAMAWAGFMDEQWGARRGGDHPPGARRWDTF